MTWFVDCATNTVMGVAVTPGYPSRESVLAALRAAVLRVAEAAAALAALKKPRSADREILLLCVWSGLSQEEVAQVCDVPVGTVRSRLSRARARLHKLAAALLAEPSASRRTTTGSRST
ncbi:sigma factor-like helix-turn-helix DNA-binding protein [Streptomyces goshikiensis]